MEVLTTVKPFWNESWVERNVVFSNIRIPTHDLLITTTFFFSFQVSTEGSERGMPRKSWRPGEKND